MPGDIIPKDPQITSKAVTPSFVYLQVKVPVANVTMVNEDGTRTEKEEHQLITYGCGETADSVDGPEAALDMEHGLTANVGKNTEDSWSLVKAETTQTDASDPVSVITCIRIPIIKCCWREKQQSLFLKKYG